MTQLRTDVVVEQDYDSNIFATTNNPQGSAVTVVRPGIHVDNTGTLGHVRLDGWLSSHTYWEESSLNGVDRGAGGDFDRTIFPRISIFGNGSYQRIASRPEIRGSDVVTVGNTPGVPSEPVISPGQVIEGSVPEVDLAQGEFGARYLLTPRSKLTLSGGPYSVNYLQSAIGRTDLRDRSGWFSQLQLQHELSALDSLTVEIGGNSTGFSDAIRGTVAVNDPTNPHTVELNTGKTSSDQLSLTIGWDRTWSEVWKTHIDVGGRRLETRTSDELQPLTRVGPGFGDVQPFTDFVPTKFNETGPGIIGEFSLERTLPRGSLGLSYSRETRTTSSLSSSNVDVDNVSLSYIHRLSARGTLTLLGSYEHYVSANNSSQFGPATYIPGSFNPITGPEYACSSGALITNGSGASKTGQCLLGTSSTLRSNFALATARFDWQLRKRLTTFVVVRYVDRSGDAQLFGNAYNRFNVGIGFHYDYNLGF